MLFHVPEYVHHRPQTFRDVSAGIAHQTEHTSLSLGSQTHETFSHALRSAYRAFLLRALSGGGS